MITAATTSVPRILMVCLGNICRSPMAEGILRHKAAARGIAITIDSAGTGSWHEGQSPDERAVRNLRTCNIDISGLRARTFSAKDFDDFDYIFVMDSANYNDVKRMARSPEDLAKISLILNTIHKDKNMAVPDPYFGGDEGFNHVYRLLDEACDRILDIVST